MLTDRLPYVFEPRHADLERLAGAFTAQGTMRERVRALAEDGLLRHTAGAADVRTLAAIRAALAYRDGLNDLAFVVQELGGYPLSRVPAFAREAEDARTGRALTVFALTEPEAGSDVRGLRAEAVRHGDTYHLTGEKCFISNAPEADRAVVFARLDGAIGCFLVESPDVEPQAVSGHSIGRIHLRDTPARLVSAKGSALAFGTLERCRPTVGAAAVGFAQRALDETCRYVSVRRQFGAPLAKLPAVRMRVAQMALDLENAAYAVGHACWRRDHAPPEVRTGYESAVAKVTATEAAWRVVDTAVQLHGGRGVEEDAVVQRLLRDVRPLRIYEGATDVLLLAIADHWLPESDT